MYSEEILKKVVNLGSLRYPVEKCMNVLQLDGESRKEFEKDFLNQDSEIAKNYQTGIDVADFEIDTKLFNLARTGDPKAIKAFDERIKKKRIYQNRSTQISIFRNALIKIKLIKPII